MIFPRLPYPALDLSRIVPRRQAHQTIDFLLHGAEKDHLMSSYVVLVTRILSDSPRFAWLKKYVPNHIPHDYEHYMALPSCVIPLNILDKNEAKYEDCLDICDDYERQMVALHTDVFGEI